MTFEDDVQTTKRELDEIVKGSFSAHNTRHENGGGDEISIAGLSGQAADNQNPTAHATEHVDGTDDIQNATAAQKGVATAAQITKLDGIEALADVTDSTNVNAVVKRIIIIKVIDDVTALTTGDGKTHVTIPIEMNGMNLISVGAHVYTASSSGLPTVMIHNLTDTVDMLSTAITIDANEKDSKDAATPPAINAATDDVATGDEIRIDVDIAGTGTLGLEIRMGFQTP